MICPLCPAGLLSPCGRRRSRSFLYDGAAKDDPSEDVEDVAAIVDGPAGVAAFVEDAMHPDLVDVVVQLHDVLALPAVHPSQIVSRLLEVMESSLAVEVYEREMRRREPRDAESWH
jgi:hypothetical protein